MRILLYSDASLSLCLDNYWNLFEGILPGDAGRTSINGNPYESAWVLKADIDAALSALSDSWHDVLSAMNAYYSDGTDPKLIFYDDKKYYRVLNKYQRSIVRHHLKIEIHNTYTDLMEVNISKGARELMLNYLNNGIHP